MKLLADENFDAAIVRWLRSIGHDVAYIIEMTRAITDRDVIQTACRDDRIILTADLDFGDLVVRHLEPVPGVVLLRLRVQTEEGRLHLSNTGPPSSREPGARWSWRPTVACASGR